MKRREVLALRISAQQLDRPIGSRPVTDVDIFDFGVQDTGRDGASWAIVNRGVPLASSNELESAAEVALAWTLRGAPHFYRRTDLPDVLVATSPFSDKDAAKRVIGADKPLNEAGIKTLDGLTEVATQMRAVVTKPMSKGDVSTALTKRLADPYLRYCRPCGATHSWEQPFRLGALYAGLELQPGTSPPILQRIPGWHKRDPGPAADPSSAPERLQPIRNYLRFLGPASPNDVAAFLDASVADIKAHWPLPYARGIAVKADNPEVLFAGCGETTTGENGYILRTTDAGINWEILTLPVQPNATIWGFATHPANADRILAFSLFGEVYVSEDGGESWRKIEREFGEIRAIAWLPN